MPPSRHPNFPEPGDGENTKHEIGTPVLGARTGLLFIFRVRVYLERRALHLAASGWILSTSS